MKKFTAGEIDLSHNSLIEIENSIFETHGTTKITGNTPNLRTDVDPEQDFEYISPNISQHRSGVFSNGDRIIFNSSTVNIGEQTKIYSKGTKRWAGIYFLNCRNNEDATIIENFLKQNQLPEFRVFELNLV